MSRVVFVTQRLDPDDPIHGIVVAQVAALARRVDELVVVADRIVPGALPANARGRTFAARTQAGRGARLVIAVARELRGLDAVIVHQVPLYAIVLAPLVRPAGVPLVMWWSHWKMDRVVRTAAAVCTRVVTVGPTTFPHPTKKLVTVGQGIDVDAFPARRRDSQGPLRALVIGRYSPAKGLETILRGVKLARERGADLRLDVYGPAPTAETRAELERLRRLVGELGLVGSVELHGPVTRAKVVELLANADVLLNNAPGGADRIVYEAAASGVPVLASNPAHENILEPDSFYARDDPEGLAAKLVAFASLPHAEREELGRHLAEHARREHSVASWAAGLLGAAGITPP